MTDTTNTTDRTETPVEGKKKAGRPATYDAEVFCQALREVHAAGGDVAALAERLGMPKTKVNQISAHLRNKGEDLPRFKRGRRPGQKSAPKAEVSSETTETLAPESA